LRECQIEAMNALGNYFLAGGQTAACVCRWGAGKTALGVAACLAFARRRALVVTPGSVIRGTFDRALDHEAVGNVLYGLPGGPLIPGSPPPRVLTLDSDEGSIRGVTREELLGAHVVITNFHSLGSGADPDDLLGKLAPDDVDLIVVDEAHIAAAESYQRLFGHFPRARTLLMSACFQRLDGKPIDADVVFRYRLIDSIADGHAKNMRVQRFAPDAAATTYELVWPDGTREEIVGREAILDILGDERKLARITAKSPEPIRAMMRAARAALDRQAESLHPVKPPPSSRRWGNGMRSRSRASRKSRASRAQHCTTRCPRPPSGALGHDSSRTPATCRGWSCSRCSGRATTSRRSASSCRCARTTASTSSIISSDEASG